VPLGNLRDIEPLPEQKSDGHAFFELSIKIVVGWGVVDGRNLVD